MLISSPFSSSHVKPDRFLRWETVWNQDLSYKTIRLGGYQLARKPIHTLLHLALHFPAVFGPPFFVTCCKCAAAAFQTDCLKPSPSLALSLLAIRKLIRAASSTSNHQTLPSAPVLVWEAPSELLWLELGGLLCVCISLTIESEVKLSQVSQYGHHSPTPHAVREIKNLVAG